MNRKLHINQVAELLLYLLILWDISRICHGGGVPFLQVASDSDALIKASSHVGPSNVARISLAEYGNILQSERAKAETCLLFHKKNLSKQDLLRTVLALYLADPLDFQNSSNRDFRRLKKEIKLQTTLELSRGSFETMPLSAFSHYVIALMATCRDPNNFYGVDLVEKLKNRKTLEETSTSRTVSPFVYLALCLAGNSNANDLYKLSQILVSNRSWPQKLDLWAMAVLAISCIEKSSPQATYKDHALSSFLTRASIVHLGNVYETALVIQAMSALDYLGQWNFEKAVDFVLEHQDEEGCFGDVLATYYAMPILSGHTLQSLKGGCTKGRLLDASIVGKSIEVSYSLTFGKDIESLTLHLQLPFNANFLDLMKRGAKENEAFRFKYEETSPGSISVYSFGQVTNDAEKCLRWVPYKRNNGTKPTMSEISDIKQYAESNRLQNGDQFVFWYKKMDV